MTGKTGIYDVKIYMTGKNTDKGNPLNHTGFCGIMNMEKYMCKAGVIFDVKSNCLSYIRHFTRMINKLPKMI